MNYPTDNTTKILICTWGLRGDIQPLLGLADGLRKAGYYVALQANIYAKEIVEYYGFPFYSLSGNVEKENPFSEFKDNSEKNEIALKPKQPGEWAEPQMKIPLEIEGIAKSFDMIIAHSLLWEQAYLVHKRLKIPLVGFALSPQYPTKHFKSTIVHNDYFDFDPVKNVESWKSLAKIRAHHSADMYNKYTEDWKLTKTDNPWGWLGDFWYKAKIPIIHAFSPQVLNEVPDDWPAHVNTVGYIEFPTPDIIKLDPTIEDWLEKDVDKPILITFGSMSVSEANYMLNLAHIVIRTLGLRVILSSGTGKTDPNDSLISEKLLVIKGAPYNLLFPNCSAVVHHGGPGTTGTALKAGIPQIIISFFSEQPFWGDCVNRIGAGPPPLHFRSLREEDLIDNIRYALRENVREKATEIGMSIGLEDGVRNSVKIIDQYFTDYTRKHQEKVKHESDMMIPGLVNKNMVHT
jgi:UDP:flavonoid glycosyltransferase YjiC (YdhE family)